MIYIYIGGMVSIYTYIIINIYLAWFMIGGMVTIYECL